MFKFFLSGSSAHIKALPHDHRMITCESPEPRTPHEANMRMGHQSHEIAVILTRPGVLEPGRHRVLQHRITFVFNCIIKTGLVVLMSIYKMKIKN